MTTALDIDIQELVGEMEAPACEHSQHATLKLIHDDGPATHYARAIHYCRPAPSHAIAVCQRMADAIQTGRPVRCTCGDFATMDETHELLGPVNA